MKRLIVFAAFAVLLACGSQAEARLFKHRIMGHRRHSACSGGSCAVSVVPAPAVTAIAAPEAAPVVQSGPIAPVAPK